MDGRRAAESCPGLCDRLHHRRRLGGAKTRSSDLLGHCDAKIPGFGKRPDERFGIGTIMIRLPPIGGVETGADARYPLADGSGLA
jgi:hypothetical protein